NAANVYYATQEFERSGAAGVFFEDQTFPKRCGHMPGKAVIPAAEMAAKIAAAVDARADRELVVIARTDAATSEGVTDAIFRANLYCDAGADLVSPDAVIPRADIERYVDKIIRHPEI